jgi:subtilase family serine protease
MRVRIAISVGAACATSVGIALAGITPAVGANFRLPGGVGRMHPAAGTGGHYASTSVDSTGTFGCQSPSHAPYNCYGPSQMRAAYDVQSLIAAGNNGSGQTIVIVDAYQNPTMASDLSQFDTVFGLDAPPSFTTVAPQGITPFDAADPNQVGWSGEIALDVEWAHAMAPGAGIVLALAASDNDADLIAVERYVVQHHLGNIMSMSFGEAEACMAPSLRSQEHNIYASANAAGITVLAATGDNGSAQWSCDGNSFIKAASIPATDPNVTAVGGTDLTANLSTGNYKSETAWNEPSYPMAGGGGFSSLYSKPDYQSGSAPGSARGVPDVSYSASAAHGVVVGWGSSGDPTGEFWIFAGTSAGTPQWGALVAIADQSAQRGLGNINPALYRASRSDANGSAFHDITRGNNAYAPFSGYTAAAGWDAATGLGSPSAATLIPKLISG